MDGEVARAQKLSSARGAFFDSTIDRVSDGLMFGGCVVYYAGTPIMYAALVALIMSFVISYARSRAEALGLTGAEGLMQRADRITMLSMALAFSPFIGHRMEGFVRHPLYAITAGGAGPHGAAQHGDRHRAHHLDDEAAGWAGAPSGAGADR